jgi:hypothetical protein
MLQYQRVNDRVVQANFRNPETGMWAISCEHGKRTEQTTCVACQLLSTIVIYQNLRRIFRWRQMGSKGYCEKTHMICIDTPFCSVFQLHALNESGRFPNDWSSFQIDLLGAVSYDFQIPTSAPAGADVADQEDTKNSRLWPEMAQQNSGRQLISNFKMESTMQNPGLLLSSWEELVFLVFLTGETPRNHGFQTLWIVILLFSGFKSSITKHSGFWYVLIFHPHRVSLCMTSEINHQQK